MTTEHDEHDHDEHDHGHELVELADTDEVTAFDERPHNVISLQFHTRGFSLQLTFDDALVLADVMATVGQYVKHQRE